MIPINNQTRYRTEDIEALINAVTSAMGKSIWWKEMVSYDVLYYEPTSKPMCEGRGGPFVQFGRNSDEHSTRKRLGLVRPTKMKNISDLEKIACLASREVPFAMVEEIAIRLREIINHHESRHPSTCDSANASLKYATEFTSLIPTWGISLRFDDAEISAEKKQIRAAYYSYQVEVTQHATEFAEASSIVKNLQSRINRLELELSARMDELPGYLASRDRAEENLTQAKQRAEAFISKHHAMR